jgi:hypothetical protein
LDRICSAHLEPQYFDRHTLLDTLRDDRVSPVCTPCNEDLRRSGAEFVGNLLNNNVFGEHRDAHHCEETQLIKQSGEIEKFSSRRRTVVSKRAVCCDVDGLFLAVRNKVVLRKKRVGFDLVSRLRMNVVSTEDRRSEEKGRIQGRHRWHL